MCLSSQRNVQPHLIVGDARHQYAALTLPQLHKPRWHGHVLDFIFWRLHLVVVTWRVHIAEEFEPEMSVLPLEVRRAILAHSRLLREYGPQLGRPRVDTLNGSRHANMKEMRFGASGGEWRVAFAFDPVRRAMLLVAGDKSGGNERRF